MNDLSNDDKKIIEAGTLFLARHPKQAMEMLAMCAGMMQHMSKHEREDLSFGMFMCGIDAGAFPMMVAGIFDSRKGEDATLDLTIERIQGLKRLWTEKQAQKAAKGMN